MMITHYLHKDFLTKDRDNSALCGTAKHAEGKALACAFCFEVDMPVTCDACILLFFSNKSDVYTSYYFHPCEDQHG